MARSVVSRLSLGCLVVLGLSLPLSVWAQSISILNFSPKPLDNQLQITLAQPMQAMLSTTVENGERKLLIDMPGASLQDLPNKERLIELIQKQLKDVRAVSIDEFRMGDPYVRMTLTMRSAEVSGLLVKNQANTLVLQLTRTPAITMTGSQAGNSMESSKSPRSIDWSRQLTTPQSLAAVGLPAQTVPPMGQLKLKLTPKTPDIKSLNADKHALTEDIKTLETQIRSKEQQLQQLRVEEKRAAEANAASVARKAQPNTSLQKLETAYQEALAKNRALQAQLEQAQQPSFSRSEAKITDSVSDAMTQKAEAESIYQRGKRAEQNGRLAEAMSAYQEALRKAPKETDYALSLAMLAMNQQELDTAQSTLESALVFHPTHSELLNELGKVALLKKDVTFALKYFGRAIPVGALSNYASTLKRAQKLSEAEAAYKLALSLNPSDSDLQFNLGNLYLSQKRYPEAQERFKEAVRLNPNFGEAHYHLGLTYIEQGQATKAREALTTYLDKMPSAPNRTAVEAYLKDMAKAYGP